MSQAGASPSPGNLLQSPEASGSLVPQIPQHTQHLTPQIVIACLLAPQPHSSIFLPSPLQNLKEARMPAYLLASQASAGEMGFTPPPLVPVRYLGAWVPGNGSHPPEYLQGRGKESGLWFLTSLDGISPLKVPSL